MRVLIFFTVFSYTYDLQKFDIPSISISPYIQERASKIDKSHLYASFLAVTLREIVDYICQRDMTHGVCTSYMEAFNNSTKEVVGLNVVLANMTEDGQERSVEVQKVMLDEPQITEGPVDTEDTKKKKEVFSSKSIELQERDLPIEVTTIDNHEKESTEEPPPRGDVPVYKKNTNDFQAAKREYCQLFKSNYTRLCSNELTIFTMDQNMRRVKLFCGSYRINCIPHYGIDCTPECDERFHPHCTVECKCDYLYPLIVKFCRPLHNPNMEETCNSWFDLCSQRYVFGETRRSEAK